jgi:hypothetical protein
MNNYTAVFIGLPQLLKDEDADQQMPLEVDDTCIEKSRILSQPAGKMSAISGTNAYIKLHKILENVVEHLYPMKRMRRGPRKSSLSCMVSISKVQEIEEELHEWHRTLPAALHLEKEATGSLLR